MQRIAEKYKFTPKPWNLGYHIEKDKKEVCEFDILEFKKYFEYQAVTKRFISLIEKLFNVKMEIVQ